jgi:hypothetical protein
MTYRRTHQSTTDASPAMLVSSTDQTVTLMNEDGFEWSDSADQWEEIVFSLHAHVFTSSRDCDGGHGNEYTMTYSPEEIEESKQEFNDFSDIHFMQRVMMNVASPYAVEYGMTVTVDSEGIDVHENTDEGSRAANVRWCHDEMCDPMVSSQYDQFAEAMGY